MIKQTKDTRTALHRLATAAGWSVEQAPGERCVRVCTPGDPDGPIAKSPLQALAFLAEGLRAQPDWPELREATAWTPTHIPDKSLTAWEWAALHRLAWRTP